MKHMKKAFAVIMALAMIFALSTVALADTLVDHVQDANYLTLSVTGANPLTYSAVTVEGRNLYPDVTTYSYYATFPTGFNSLSSVAVSAEYPVSYTLYLDSVAQSYTTSNNKRTSSFNVNFSVGHVLELRNGNTVVRTYQLAGGISGEVLPTIYMRINVEEAVEWQENYGLTGDPADALEYIIENCPGMDEDGEMAAVAISNLPAGSTVMDALWYLCYGAPANSNIVMMCNGITITSLGLSLEGDGNQRTELTYLTGIGDPDGTYFLSAFDTDINSGWLYSDQNGYATYGAAQYYLVGGESILWEFVNDYTEHLNFT